MKDKKILTVESHVVHGYVGGRAAIFPLQVQGWEVDSVNSVEFSNHTGYGSYRGSHASSELFNSLFEGLEDLDINYDAVLSGYMPNGDLIELTGKFIRRLREKRPEILYLMDPVMGDQGYVYVDESCIKAYRDMLKKKLVDIITPNQFELELLCGFKIYTEHDLKKAISELHDEHNVRIIVVTSVDENLCISGKDNTRKDILYCVISAAESKDKIEIFTIPIIRTYFTGVGDLFSALLMDKLYTNLKNSKLKSDLEILSLSVNQVLTVILKVLKLTFELGQKGKGVTSEIEQQREGRMNDANSMKHFELKVIESKNFYNYSENGEFISETI